MGAVTSARLSGTAGVPSQRILMLIVFTVCGLAAAVVAITEWHDRERRLESARREAMTLARVLEEQTEGMLWATDLALLGIGESLRRDPTLREHDPAFEDSLRRLLANLPAVRAFFVVGPDGFIIQNSDHDTPRWSLADRDYFRAHVEDPNRGLFVGQPLDSRSKGTLFIGVSRRVETSPGGFAGIAVAAIEVRYFERFYEELGLGGGDLIALATRDGVLVARQPRADERVGKRLVFGDGRSVLETALAHATAGSFEAVSTIDGTSRIIGYRALANHPLIVLVGLSREHVLGPWRRGAAGAAASTMAAVGLAALLLWLAMLHARREAATQARAAQAARLEALGSLTSGVAHDFNNLLQAMSSALRLLGSFTNDDARAAKVIAHGLTSMERSRGLVAQLLGVARPQELEARDVDLNAILSEMAILLENAAAPKARLELDLRADVQPCRADASRLDAAILNLVVNARDAMPPDRPGMGLIRISTANCARAVVSRDGRRVQRGEFVCVTVRDNGVGMPPEVCRRALEPFFTTKGERGTGLGLSQIYAFVRELGGDMQIESEINAGTAVHLYLPRARPQSRQDRQGQAAATHAG